MSATASTRTGATARPMRSERMVVLRSAMPVHLVTLRHTVPLRLQGVQPEALRTTTPKVEGAQRAVETAAGKNG